MSVVIIILLAGFVRTLVGDGGIQQHPYLFLYSAGYQNPHNNLKSYARRPNYKRLDVLLCHT